jgi:hypothetical protein
MNHKKRVWQYLFAFIIISAYCTESYFLFKLNEHPCEDAYITYRFAKNLAEGNGPVFNKGERVEGYSNFLWMAAISGAYRLGFDMEVFSRFVCWLANTILFILVWYILYRYFNTRGFSLLVAPLLYVLFLPLHYVATCGLETVVYAMLIVLCVQTLLWAQSRPLPFAVAGFILFLIALCRPEGVLCFVFYAGYLVYRSFAHKETLRPYLSGIILFIIFYSLFILWRFSYYHALVPNTYYAKGTLPLLIRAGLGMFTARGFITRYPYFAIFLFMLWKAGKLSADRSSLAPVFCFIAATLGFSIYFSGFDWLPFFRYTLPAVPLIIIVCVIIFAQLWNHVLPAKSMVQRMIWGGLTVGCFMLASEQFYADLLFNFRYRDMDAFGYYNQRVFAEWLKREVGSGPVICVGDVGRLAYYSEANILDIFGLMSKDFAALKKQQTAPELKLPLCSISFDRYKDQERTLLLRLQPEYVMLYNARLKIAHSYFGSSAGIVEHEDFKNRYEFLGCFNIVPDISSRSFPKPYYFNPMLDLSAGLFAWIYDGWGYDIYVRKDYPGKRFKIELYPDDRIKTITVTK